MKTEQEFREFYETELEQCLDELENKRIIEEKASTRTRKKASKIALVMSVIVTALLMKIQGYPITDIGSIFQYFTSTFIIVFLITYQSACKNEKTVNFQENFDTKVKKTIVSFFDKNLMLSVNEGISFEEFMESKIFYRTPDIFDSSTMIWGKYRDVNIKINKVRAAIKRSKDSDEIFNGVFIVADLNKNISGETYVLPDFAQKNMGWVGQMLQEHSFKGELVKLEDVNFENNFVVYSTDQIEARYILTPALIQTISDLEKKYCKDENNIGLLYKDKIYFAFLNSKVYIGLPIGEYYNMFSNPFFSINNYDAMLKYYNGVKYALDVIEALNLDTRIWSKSDS